MEGKLRIWFVYKGVRVRENLGGSLKHGKKQAHCRSSCASVCYAIKTGVFDSGFPPHTIWKNLVRPDRLTAKGTGWKISGTERSGSRKNVTQHVPCRHQKYLSIIGEKNLASSINKEKNCWRYVKRVTYWIPDPQSNYIVTQPGRSAVTVNNYMTNLYAVFQFGVDNGYLADNPFKGISPLKESRTIPDPLSREEFIRLIDACRNQQAKIYGAFLLWHSPPEWLARLAWGGR